MKTKTGILVCIFLILSAAGLTACTNAEKAAGENTPIPFETVPPSEDQAALRAIYATYQEAVQEKSQEDFSSLFFEPRSPLYILVYVNNAPRLYIDDAYTWSGALDSAGEYEIVIEAVDFKIMDNVAISRDEFHSTAGYFGNHLNLHIKTSGGWKIVCVNVTDKPANPDQYNSPMAVAGGVQGVLDAFVESYNNQQGEDIKRLIFGPSSRMIQVEAGSVYAKPYDKGVNLIAAFADSISQAPASLQLSLSDPVIEIADNYLASVVVEYQLRAGGEVMEAGLQVWTLVPASAPMGWRITCMIWQKALD